MLFADRGPVVQYKPVFVYIIKEEPLLEMAFPRAVLLVLLSENVSLDKKLNVVVADELLDQSNVLWVGQLVLHFLSVELQLLPHTFYAKKKNFLVVVYVKEWNNLGLLADVLDFLVQRTCLFGRDQVLPQDQRFKLNYILLDDVKQLIDSDDFVFLLKRFNEFQELVIIIYSLLLL